MTQFRIGTGAGFSGDRIEPAVTLVERGGLDVLVFECLAERTIALAQQAKLANPASGFDPMLAARMRAILPLAQAQGTRIVTNMGAANPRAAAELTRDIARELGLTGLRIAAITGDDVSGLLRGTGLSLQESYLDPQQVQAGFVSANAYIGAEPIAKALNAGADVVICGRVADPALFLGPLVHHYGWSMQDWDRLGRGTLVGHLLECSAQITGGYFADPGVKDVADLVHIGFPWAEVDADGHAVIGKCPGTGGRVDRATCTEQLLYEIHDPARYLQPDVIADFSQVRFEQVGQDRVAVSGGSGWPATGLLKVSIGYQDGWVGEGQISYAGPNAVARARLALDIVRSRIQEFGPAVLETREALIGLDSILPLDDALSRPEPYEVRMRFVARCADAQEAERVAQEVESLYLCGPAGGGGVAKQVRRILGIASTLIPAVQVSPEIELLES